MIQHGAAIRYFDAARRAGSIRGAARKLNIASSAVNRQILKLEDELGETLFERMPGGLKLTPAGEIFARHANNVLNDARRTEEELTALRGLQRGHVRLIAVESLATDLLPSAIGRLRSDYPLINISVTITGSRAVAAAVVAGDADIGLAFLLPRIADLRQVAVGQFRLGAVMAPSHPLARRKSVTLKTCADFPWYLPSEALSIREQLEPALRRLDRPAPAAVEASSVELMKRLALRGDGICFQSVFGLEEEIAGSRLVHVPLADPDVPLGELGIYVRVGHASSSAQAMLIEILIEEVTARAHHEATAAKAPRYGMAGRITP